MGRRLPLGLGILLVSACAPGGLPGLRGARVPELSGAAGPPAHVVLIDVAGLTAPLASPEPGGPRLLPMVAALGDAGVSAQEVEPAAPASSRPVAATLLTGRTPSRHGVAGEWWQEVPGGTHGIVARVPVPTEPTLLSVAAARGFGAGALAWPGARREGLRVFSPEAVLDAAAAAGGDADAPARDARLVDLACDAFAGDPPPRLLVLRLAQGAAAVRADGPASAAARAAWGRVDREVARLVRCLESAARIDRTAIFLAGDHALVDWHTTIEPNVALARAGLVTPQTPGPGIAAWSAVARSSGGSAFVYARSERDAMLARRALEEAAAQTPGFRVVPAEEMMRLGADPEAWFGLDAEPGFAFGIAAAGPLVHAAAGKGVGGYLASRPSPAFVAFGRGVRSRVRIPRLRQVDVAPTLARLLGLSVPGAEGGVLVGVLDPAASPPVNLTLEKIDDL